MFGQFPFAGASAGAVDGAVVVPESDVDELPLDESADGVVVVVELSSAANASAVPPPTRAPVRATATAVFWIHFMVITSSSFPSWWFEGSQDRQCKNGARTRAVGRKIASGAARRRLG
jgi:hypothetical protein